MPDPANLSAILSALAAAADALSLAARAIAGAQPLASLPPSPPPKTQSHAFPTHSPPAVRQPADSVRLSGDIHPIDQVDLVGAVNAFLVAKARSGRSDRYVRQLRVILSSLAAHAGPGAGFEVLTPECLEKWVFRNRRWSTRTKRGALLDSRTFLAWCVRRGLTRSNPALAVELPTVAARAPGIHTPDQVAAVLAWCRSRDPDVARCLAIRYFAGVRTAELLRMREEHLHLARGFLEVPAAASKTRSRRLVTIHPALAAWLAIEGGTIPAGERRIREVVRGAGVPWSPNVTRHTFASMHLAGFGNAARTALECGHAEAILFRHYRELVSPDQAGAFWALRP